MIKFLIKGLLRDHHRSLFPVIMVSSGVFLTVFLYSWMGGVLSDFVRSYAQYNTGHVKITTRAYQEIADQTPNDLALLGTASLLETLKEKYPDMIWVPRIRFGGLLDVPDQ
ncbi:MAG: hypothetical protein ABH857_03195, partial [Elusimicrobiota bacterium]